MSAILANNLFGGAMLRIPIRGYEKIIDTKKPNPYGLRIPIRGYECSCVAAGISTSPVTNPYKGL